MDSSTKENVQELPVPETGDLLRFQCNCMGCQITGNHTELAAIVMGVNDDGKLSISPDGEEADEATLNGNELIIPGTGKTYTVTAVKKGEGNERLARHKEYTELKEKHLAADISEEEFSEIADNFNEKVRFLIPTTLNDDSVSDNRYVTTAMILELAGIQATKEQIVAVSTLMSDATPAGGEDLLAALLGSGSPAIMVSDPVTAALLSHPTGPKH